MNIQPNEEITRILYEAYGFAYENTKTCPSAFNHVLMGKYTDLLLRSVVDAGMSVDNMSGDEYDKGVRDTMNAIKLKFGME
jgi:hypothetical protein